VSKATRLAAADDFTVAAALYDSRASPKTSAQLQQAALKLADTPAGAGRQSTGPQLLGARRDSCNSGPLVNQPFWPAAVLIKAEPLEPRRFLNQRYWGLPMNRRASSLVGRMPLAEGSALVIADDSRGDIDHQLPFLALVVRGPEERGLAVVAKGIRATSILRDVKVGRSRGGDQGLILSRTPRAPVSSRRHTSGC